MGSTLKAAKSKMFKKRTRPAGVREKLETDENAPGPSEVNERDLVPSEEVEGEGEEDAGCVHFLFASFYSASCPEYIPSQFSTAVHSLQQVPFVDRRLRNS